MPKDTVQALYDSAKVIAAAILVMTLLTIAGCSSTYRCPAYGQQQYSRH